MNARRFGRGGRGGFGLYEALLALALCGIAIIALNFAAASAAVSSQVARNRLFVQTLIRNKIIEHRGAVGELAGQGEVKSVLESRSTTFVTFVRASKWKGNSGVYKLDVVVEWTERSRDCKREKSVLIMEKKP